MLTSIWTVVILFAGVSLFTADPVPLVAGLILAGVGVAVEKFYK